MFCANSFSSVILSCMHSAFQTLLPLRTPRLWTHQNAVSRQDMHCSRSWRNRWRNWKFFASDRTLPRKVQLWVMCCVSLIIHGDAWWRIISHVVQRGACSCWWAFNKCTFQMCYRSDVISFHNQNYCRPSAFNFSTDRTKDKIDLYFLHII